MNTASAHEFFAASASVAGALIGLGSLVRERLRAREGPAHEHPERAL